MARPKDDDDQYDALDDHAHSRLRPENLFGSREPHTQVLPGFRNGVLALHESTWVPALWTMFREIIDNALDELNKHGYGDTLRIEFDPKSLTASVHDNGRGLPIREIAKLGKGPAASLLLSKARASRNFKEQGEGAGMNGVGASAVNFTAAFFELTVDRDGTQDRDGAKHLTQRWEEAERAGQPLHKTKGPHTIRGSKQRSGTLVRYQPSIKLYPKRMLPLEFVQDRVWDIAVINPQIKVWLNGTRIEPKPGKDPILSTYFAERTASVAEINQEGFRSRFYIVPNFTKDREASLAIVNNIPVFAGASYVNAFRTLYTGTVMEELKRRTKKEELSFSRDMVAQGILIYGVAFMQAPRFNSQAKIELVSDVGGAVRTGYLASDILSMIRRNPDWVEDIIERARSKTSDADSKKIKRAQRDLKRMRIAALDDASHRNRSDCILFVMEGESAMGLLSDEREDYHGILPLQGKIMNVRKHKPLDVVQDPTLSNLMGALGLVMDMPAHRRRLRYGAVYIATDEDEDGKNITALLMNFFYQYWPELFRETPYVNRFCTPYLILTRGKDIQYIYAQDYENFQKNPEQFRGWTVTRAKGLGTLNKQAWKHVLKQPMLIPLLDDGKLDKTLSLIFDPDREEDRKEWLKGAKK